MEAERAEDPCAFAKLDMCRPVARTLLSIARTLGGVRAQTSSRRPGKEQGKL